MTRAARNQRALHGHGTALALTGAAAAAVASVAGAASAATATPQHPAAARHGIVAAGTAGSLTSKITGNTGKGAGLFGGNSAAVVHPAAVHAVPARRPVQLDVRAAAVPGTKPGAADRARPASGHQAAPQAGPTHAHEVAARHAAPARPYRIYDSVTPSQIPAHHQIATYADGGYAVAPSAVAGRGHVVWIDTNGSDPRAAALDVEPGDATPATAAAWVRAKLTASPNSPAIIYTMRSEWAATRASVNSLPAHMRSEVRWWIADPTGYPHIVPGASATQWYWGKNYDISSAKPGF